MTKVQFQTGRKLTSVVNDFLLGNSNSDVEDLLDEIQLAYLSDELSDLDYNELIAKLEPSIGS